MTKWPRARAVGFGVVALVLALGSAILATAGLVSSQQGPTVSIEDGEVPTGGTEVTRLSALNVSSPALCGFTIDVAYDRPVKVATDCDADPEDNFNAALCNVDYASGTVRVVGASVEGVTGNIPLVDITWCAVGSAGHSTDLDVQIVSFKDCQTPPVEIATVADQDGVNIIVAGAPPVDTDSDGFGDCVELYLGTDPTDACTDEPSDLDAWPFDINMDTWADILDVLMFKPKLEPKPYDPRFDLKANGIVDILDVLLFKPVLHTHCTP